MNDLYYNLVSSKFQVPLNLLKIFVTVVVSNFALIVGFNRIDPKQKKRSAGLHLT